MSIESAHREPASPSRRAPATSAGVARVAGVARSTVSHILNGQVERFSLDTVERVRKVAAELGYVPSAAGRALVNGRSDLMVLVLPNTTLTNVQDIVEAIAVDLAALGFSMVVHFSIPGAAGDPLARLQHTVETLRPAGLIDLGGLTRRELQMIDQQGCPVVSPPLDDSATMADGNVFIGRIQAEHLIERGHDRLVYAYLADRRDDPFGRVRAQAAAEVCAARGIAAPARLDVPLDREGARAALAGLLAHGGGPVGIACSNDEVALALTFAAIGLGVAVPEVVAAVGVGGGQVGQLVTPRLTSVAFDLRASLAPIRAAIAHACTATGEPLAIPSGDAFSILQGQTT